jgi:hypothetical protein
MSENSHSRKAFLADILVKHGICDQDSVKKAFAKAKETNRRIGSVLVEMGLISEKDLVYALARQYGAKPLFSLDGHELSPNAKDIVPVERALRHMVFPFNIRKHTLSLATCDPASHYFGLMVRVRRPVVTPYVAPFNLVLKAIASTYEVPVMLSDQRQEIFRFGGFTIPDAVRKAVMSYLVKTGNILTFDDGKFTLKKKGIGNMPQGSINAAWLLGAISIASDGTVMVCGKRIPFLFDSRKLRRRVEDILRKKSCSNEILTLALMLGANID